MAVLEETKQEVPAPTSAPAEGFVVKTNFFGKLRGIISSSSPKKLIAFAAIGFLIIVLPLAVIMSQRVQETRQRASEASRIEITGANVANGTATSRNVKLKLTYVPVVSPTEEPTVAPSVSPEVTISTTVTPETTLTVSPSEIPPTATSVPPTATIVPPSPTITSTGQPVQTSPTVTQYGSNCQALYTKIVDGMNKSCDQPGYDPVADVNTTKDRIINQRDLDIFNSRSRYPTAEAWCLDALGSTTSPCVQGVATAQEASTTLQFRASNDQNTLEQAQVQSFTPEELTASPITKEIDWQLTEGNGAKTVFAQFKFGDAAWESVLSTTVSLNEATAATTATGQSWSFSSDFSGVQGQRDLYYKRFTIVVGARGQSSAGGRYGEAIWDSANNKWVGQSGVDDTSFAIAPGSLAPSVQSDAVVRWVAPQGGNVSISGAFKRCCIDTDPNQADKNIRTIYNVSKGDNQAVGPQPALWSKTVDNAEIQAWVGNNNTIATHDFSLTADVEAGNYIEFRVDPGEDGSGWDASNVSFTITYNSTTQASTPTSGQTTSAATPTTQQTQQAGGARGQESMQFAVVVGWNWIGWPFEENKRVSDLFTIIEGAHGRCSRVETRQGNSPGSPATVLGPNDSLSKGKGYTIQCSQPATFYVLGTPFTETWRELQGRFGGGEWYASFAKGMSIPATTQSRAENATAYTFMRDINFNPNINYRCSSISVWDPSNQRMDIYTDDLRKTFGGWQGLGRNFDITASDPTVAYGIACQAMAGGASTTSQPSPTPRPAQFTCTACAADIGGNGIVDMQDYSILANGDCWGKSRVQNPTDWTNNSCSSKDINRDGAVEMLDYSCLASQWSQSCPEHRR